MPIEFNGETHTISGLAKRLNLNPSRVYARIYRGWSTDKALGTPAPPPKPRRLHPLDPESGMKTCLGCGISKPAEAFYRGPGSKDGLVATCKECRSKRCAEDYKNRRAFWQKRSKDWNAANPQKHKTSAKKARLKRKYGISIEDLHRMSEQQKGCCAICGEIMKTPHVDHCHATGKVRKLLCRRCNVALGEFKDSPQLCLKAAEYLNQFIRQ